MATEFSPMHPLKILKPRNGRVEIAGAERAPFDEIVARYLKGIGEPREFVSAREARYSAAGSRSARSCRWAKRASGRIGWDEWLRAAHRQEPDPASANRHEGSIKRALTKRILCSLLVATPPLQRPR
jgi:hypothetical protein